MHVQLMLFLMNSIYRLTSENSYLKTEIFLSSPSIELERKEMYNQFVFASRNFVYGADCEYCANMARHLTKTNSGSMSMVCNLHLVLYGKKKEDSWIHQSNNTI